MTANQALPTGRHAPSRLATRLAGVLRAMRLERGLTQTEVGDRLGWAIAANGTSCANVSRYEAGGRVPKAETIGRWAKACGYTAQLIITDERGDVLWQVDLEDDG